MHAQPTYDSSSDSWVIDLTIKSPAEETRTIGHLSIGWNGDVRKANNPSQMAATIAAVHRDTKRKSSTRPGVLRGRNFEFILGDGISGARALADKSVDLLLTDPPYGISAAYTCENQVPRRLRNNGSDFIMPRGHFGDWDGPVCPAEWTDHVLPKVKGWAVIFCAQAQIGDYTDILKRHRFNSVGTLVWHKTNPVPFNHRFKPINAWEALAVGKRPGTPFHGHAVHNVFQCKSPSPQQRIHPTQKPVALLEQFVDLFSSADGLVFDPFAGSATTVVAARRRGRRCLAYERDPSIYQLAYKRVASELSDDRS